MCSSDLDHLGDMDFKVAGSADGISALQMDIKIDGITEEIMKVALEQAHGGAQLTRQRADVALLSEGAIESIFAVSSLLGWVRGVHVEEGRRGHAFHRGTQVFEHLAAVRRGELSPAPRRPR